MQQYLVIGVTDISNLNYILVFQKVTMVKDIKKNYKLSPIP